MMTAHTEHTPGTWRVGDAGHTIFGPPNGNPSPETIASVRKPDNARYIALAVNNHQALVDALSMAEKVIRWAAQDSEGRVKAEIVGGWIHHADQVRAALANAERKQ